MVNVIAIPMAMRMGELFMFLAQIHHLVSIFITRHFLATVLLKGIAIIVSVLAVAVVLVQLTDQIIITKNKIRVHIVLEQVVQ